MLVAGHQPNYLPYLGFLHKAARADLFVLVDNVQFVKRGPFGWIHRNRIRTRDGWQWLSVPTLTKGKFTQEIGEARIDPKLPWGRKHWRTLEAQYRAAPFFDAHRPFFQEYYTRPWERLADLNEAAIRYLFGAFGIGVPIKKSSELGVAGQSTGYVLDLCRKTGATAYLSGVHGRDYLDPERFRQEGVQLHFQEFHHPVYPQAWPGEFVPNLAAVDLLFNCGPDSRRILSG